MAKDLTQFSDELSQIVEAGAPAVVRVEARSRLPASGIVWSPDGVIVTAHHAVERDDNISVGLPDGRTVPATLAGRDPTTDVAVLRVDAHDLASPVWIGPESLRVGHLVLALGRPGKSVLATLGIVSALGEGWRTPNGGRIDRYLQTDVAMYPGFSGGPLVDAAGQVLGLTTSALMRGIALAVPTPTLRRVVGALLSQGRIRCGYIGVGAQPVRLSAALASQLNQETGLLLVSVEANSPAETGGLLMGDTIIGMNGQALRHLEDLQALLSDESIGKTVPTQVIRGGVVHELTVVIGERT